MQKLGTVDREIIRELYRAIDALGADPDLLATIKSWGDTLEDEQVLANLKAWNSSRGKIIADV
jgi:hypothetical protein